MCRNYSESEELREQVLELAGALRKAVSCLEYIDNHRERADGELMTGYGVRADVVAEAKRVLEAA